MFSWISPKVTVKNTRKYGKGIFSAKEIKKDELIAIFGGYIISIRDEEKLPKNMNDYGLQINEEFVLGIKKESEISKADFFNHSCCPNAGFKGQIFLVAMKNILEGDEVTFDYAMTLHKAKNGRPYRFECLCGLDVCRKYVSENDWENPKLQKKYDGYFQLYLQEIINKNKKK
jgi:uncharacterized protein